MSHADVVADGDTPPPFSEFAAHAYVRRHVAAAIFIGVLAAFLIVAALLTPRYRATASLAVMPSPEFTVREDAGARAFSNAALAMDQIMKAETEILESDDLHETTLATFGHGPAPALPGAIAVYPDLAPDAHPNAIWAGVKAVLAFLASPWRGVTVHGRDATLENALHRFSGDLRVLPAKDSNVVDVSYSHRDPAMSAAVLNAMLERYAVSRKRIYNDPQLAVAQHEADGAFAAVRLADTAMTEFKAREGFSDYAAERDLLLRRRSQAEQTLADAAGAAMQADARMGVLDTAMQGAGANSGLYQESDTDTRLQTISDSLVDLRGHLAAARLHYRDKSRLVVDLQTQIAAREAERRAMAEDGAPSLRRTGRSPAFDPLLIDRAHAAADRQAARTQVVSVQKEIAGLSASIARLDGDEITLADLTRRRAAANDSFTNASRAAADQRLTEAEDARRLANVRIIQPARVPQRPTWTKTLVCIAGLFMAVLATFGFLVLRYTASVTFLTAEGLAQATGYPVLGVFLKGNAGSLTDGATQPGSGSVPSTSRDNVRPAIPESVLRTPVESWLRTTVESGFSTSGGNVLRTTPESVPRTTKEAP